MFSIWRQVWLQLLKLALQMLRSEPEIWKTPRSGSFISWESIQLFILVCLYSNPYILIPCPTRTTKIEETTISVMTHEIVDDCSSVYWFILARVERRKLSETFMYSAIITMFLGGSFSDVGVKSVCLNIQDYKLHHISKIEWNRVLRCSIALRGSLLLAERNNCKEKLRDPFLQNQL